MTWELAKIPKIAHFFWDGNPLSFLRWASINSFSVLNPDWELRLHMTKDNIEARWKSSENKHVNCDDYRGRLADIDNLEIIDETELAGMHGVHQSDILRTKYLSEDGGLWSDVDIIYHKSMDDLECNLSDYKDRDCGICRTPKWFPIAFMLSSPGALFFERVHEIQIHQMNSAIKRKDKRRNDYQRYGTNVFKGVFKDLPLNPIPIDTSEVYQLMWKYHAKIFSGDVDLATGIGVHWYGGSTSAAEFEPQITHKNWRDFPIRNMLEVTL